MSESPIFDIEKLVKRRTFAAASAQDPVERERLNRDSMTSEHSPDRPFLVRERSNGGRTYNHCFKSLHDACTWANRNENIIIPAQ